MGGYSSTGYGAIPSISLSDLTLGNISINNGTSTTYTLGAGGTNSNAVWTSGGSGVNGWNTLTPSANITLTGEDADINLNGKSLRKWMEAMEERMNWMQPNTELEKEWDDLQELGNRYRELEKQCKEKSEAWKKLKAMPPPPENF
jgi:hypothetical protein